MKNFFFLTAAVILTALFTGCSSKKDTPPDPKYFDVGVTINGVTWATRNVAMPGTFADKPEDFGMIYQWNRKTGWPTTGSVTGWPTAPPAPSVTWAAENDPCPTGWRVPTKEQLQSLADAAIGFALYSGVKGAFFGGAVPNQIFLPAAGYRLSGGTRGGVGDYGDYWSNLSNGSWVYGLWSFYDDFVVVTDEGDLLFGCSVRCVKK